MPISVSLTAEALFKKVYFKNNKSWQTFAMKGHVVNILGSVGHTVSATTT